MEGHKALGPDGFTIAFFHICVLWKRMSWIFLNTHQHSVFEWSMNASFLTLIPMKCNAVNIKDFRPINLVGSEYKLLSKVLANKLRSVLDNFISNSKFLCWRKANSGFSAYCK